MNVSETRFSTGIADLLKREFSVYLSIKKNANRVKHVFAKKRQVSIFAKTPAQFSVTNQMARNCFGGPRETRKAGRACNPAFTTVVSFRTILKCRRWGTDTGSIDRVPGVHSNVPLLIAWKRFVFSSQVTRLMSLFRGSLVPSSQTWNLGSSFSIFLTIPPYSSSEYGSMAAPEKPCSLISCALREAFSRT